MRKRVALPLIGFAWFYGYMLSPVPEHDPLPPRIVNITREVPVEVEVPAMSEPCSEVVRKALELKEESFLYLATVGNVERTLTEMRVAMYYNDTPKIEQIKADLDDDETVIASTTRRMAQLQFDIDKLNPECEESIR